MTAVVRLLRPAGNNHGGGYIPDDGLHVEWPHPPDVEPDWWPWRWPTPTVHERVRRIRGRPQWCPTHTLTRHLIGGMLGTVSVPPDALAELCTDDGEPLLTLHPGVWGIYPT